MARLPRSCRAALGALLFASALGTAAAPAALAEAPSNDAYLSSWDMQGPHGRAARTYRAPAIDTSEATTQADLFDPDREALPFGGGPAEPTTCKGTTYGNTVWFDVHPEHAGIFDVRASGFDLVLGLYEYSETSARPTRALGCWDASRGPAEALLYDQVRRGRHYTLQVGGAAVAGAPASGPLELTFRYFADEDADGAPETLDRCPDLPGTQGGCPPRLDANPRLTTQRTQRGAKVLELVVPRVPAGARVEALCSRCGVGRQRASAPRGGGDVRLKKLIGRELPAGASIEIFVTRPASRSGDYRFGAIGDYTRYGIRAGKIATRLERCLLPGSRKPRTACR